MATNSSPNRKSVISATTSAPPGSPSIDDTYIVPTGASGAWSGQANKIAVYNGSSWDFITPHKDVFLWAEDTRDIYIYNTAGSNFSTHSQAAGTSLTVKELDGTPNVTNVSEIKVSNGTLTDNGSGSVTINNSSGASGITVRELDGTPTVSSVTEIRVTNSTLTDNGSGAVTLNLNGSGISTTTDSSANIPTAGNNGYLFFPNDGISIARDNGSTWQHWSPIFPVKPPTTSMFSWINQGSAIATDIAGGIEMAIPTSSGENVRLLKKTLAASSNYTIVCAFIPNIHAASFKNCGLMLRESSSGKLIGVSFAITAATTTPPSIQLYKWTNPTTYAGSTEGSLINFINTGVIWVKIVDNGTNRIYSVGNSKYNFIQIASTSRTSFMTPDEVGIYVNQVATDVTSGCTFIHFEEF